MTAAPPDAPAAAAPLPPTPRRSLLADLDRSTVRSVLARLLVVTLAFASINGALAAMMLQGSALNYWFLYLSPVLVSALSFGLRGGLLAAAASVVALTTLDAGFTAFVQAEQRQLTALLQGLIQASGGAAGGTTAAGAASAELPATLTRHLQSLTAGTGQLLGAIVMLSLTGGIVGWLVDRGRARERALLALAHHDALTGALSGWLWRDWLDDEVRRSGRYGRVFSLLLLDVDQLRTVNAELGRDWGDTALRELGEAVRGHVRTVDRLGRLGGDDFGVLLPETDRPGAEVVAGRMLRAMEARPVQLDDGRLLELGLSIGLVTFPAEGATRDAILGASERALARAKAQGGRTWSGLPEPVAPAVEGEAAPTNEPEPKPLIGPRIIEPETPRPQVRRRKATWTRLRW